MKTKADRRNYEIKERNKRFKICKEAHCYNDEDNEYIIRKRDIPHSLGSNYFNAYECKAIRNKQERLKYKKILKEEMLSNDVE